MTEQSKITNALKEHSDWCKIMGISRVESINEYVVNGNAIKMINMCEALHERKYVEIADKINANKDDTKIIMIAGPSSSGKTSSSLRIALQCSVLGLNPKVIELDNYFVDRRHTPKDENGEYDFESLYAMDLEFLNKQLNELLSGKEIKIPRFDFKEGKRLFDGKKMKLEKQDILIMEGIHALNPQMTSAVDSSKIFRVYASTLFFLKAGEDSHVSVSDNRMLRRMIRDNRVRNISPEETILRWSSVRRGEIKNIFPYEENADAIFNSSLLYELPLLKYYAEPLLRSIAPSSPTYEETERILHSLKYIVTLRPSEIAAIPPNSIIREFIGGQML